MTDNTQPEALRLADQLRALSFGGTCILAAAELRRQHARITELEAQLEAVGAGGVSGPMMGQPQAMPDLTTLTERGAKAWAGVDAQGLRAGAANAGSEPVAWRAQFDEWWAHNRVSTHQVKNMGGFSAKVWHAAIQTVVGATDSTAGFYPADEGSTPSRQATHPSPPEGMVGGGWIALPGALPEPGVPVLLDIGKKYPIRALWSAKHTVEAANDDTVWAEYDEATETYYCSEGWYEWNEHEEIHWAVTETPRAWAPIPPTTSAGGGEGE